MGPTHSRVRCGGAGPALPDPSRQDAREVQPGDDGARAGQEQVSAGPVSAGPEVGAWLVALRHREGRQEAAGREYTGGGVVWLFTVHDGKIKA